MKELFKNLERLVIDYNKVYNNLKLREKEGWTIRYYELSEAIT